MLQSWDVGLGRGVRGQVSASPAHLHRALCKVHILAERDVGKRQGTSEACTVRQTGEERPISRPGHGVELHGGHRYHVRELKGSQFGYAVGDRSDLRTDTRRLVKVIIVPVQDDLTLGFPHC